MVAPPPRPRLSGFCNPTLPRTPSYDPHQRCHGCECRATGCPCNPEDPTMTDTEDSAMNKIQAVVTPPDDVVLVDGSRVSALTGAGTPSDPIVLTVPEPGTPEDAVARFRSAADALNTAAAGYHPEDWRDALLLLRDLRTAMEVARKVDETLVRWLYLHGEHGQHQTLDGIPGEFYIGRGRSKERWASEEGVREYVSRRIEANDGEYPDPSDVVDWVLEVLPATASTGLRKTPLREAGMDVKDYLTSEPGTIRVDLPR